MTSSKTADNVTAPVPHGMTTGEWTLRLELAACYRLFDYLGWAELIFNHITVRVPDAASTDAHYLINPFGLHYAEVTASNLIKINLTGQMQHTSTYPVNAAGFVIHSAIHAARPDAHCIMHTHTTAGAAVASKASGLRHDNFYSAMMFEDVAYHDYEGVTTSLDEQPRLVQSLGICNHLILRNHGLLAVGPDLPSAFNRLWTLQRACEIQLASDAGTGPNREIAVDILRRVPITRLGASTGRGETNRMAFEAMLRRAGIDRRTLA